MQTRTIGLSLAVIGLLGSAGVPGSARASEIDAFLSSGGLAVISDGLPESLPQQISMEPITVGLYECNGPDATFTQSNTVIDLDITRVSLSIPSTGVLRAEIDLSTWATGTATLVNAVACGSTLVCSEDLAVLNATAVLDLSLTVDTMGNLVAEATNADLQVAPEDFSLTFSGCQFSGLVNSTIDLIRQHLLGMLLGQVENMVKAKVGPMIEDMANPYTDFSVEAGAWLVDANLSEITINGGVGALADIDLSSDVTVPSCYADPGQPGPHAGARPNLAGRNNHFGMSINLGLVDDVLYNVWAQSARCGGTVMDIDAGLIGIFLTGFPVGTTWSVSVELTEPPRVAAVPADGASIDISVEGVIVSLTAIFPDNSEKTAIVNADAMLNAEVGIDGDENALRLRLGDATIASLQIDDQIGLAAFGFDAAKIEQLANETFLPTLLSSIVNVPVTGPLAYGVFGYYGIIRDVETTSSHLILGADLFHPPANDTNAPDTTLDAPNGTVGLKNAVLRMTGTDAEIPQELLRFKISVNGFDQGEISGRSIRVGRAGTTATYEVTATAVDLAGNEDPSPATATVTVDGIRPTLEIIEGPAGIVVKSPPVRFTATDDVTPASALVARYEVYAITDDGDVLVDEVVLAAGATETQILGLDAGRYRVSLFVADQGGNEAVQSMYFTFEGESGCACTVGGRGSNGSLPAAMLLVLFGGLILRRRRA